MFALYGLLERATRHARTARHQAFFLDRHRGFAGDDAASAYGSGNLWNRTATGAGWACCASQAHWGHWLLIRCYERWPRQRGAALCLSATGLCSVLGIVVFSKQIRTNVALVLRLIVAGGSFHPMARAAEPLTCQLATERNRMRIAAPDGRGRFRSDSATRIT